MGAEALFSESEPVTVCLGSWPSTSSEVPGTCPLLFLRGRALVCRLSCSSLSECVRGAVESLLWPGLGEGQGLWRTV